MSRGASVNKEVLDFVVLIIFLNCSRKGRVQTRRNDCALSAKTQQREGQAHHETLCRATFPVKLNSVQMATLKCS